MRDRTSRHSTAFDGATTVDSDRYRGTVTAIGFRSPSGNISCGIAGDTVVCQIQSFEYTPLNCHGAGSGSSVKLKPNKPASLFCAGDVESGGPTLSYGDQLVVGPVRCVSRQDGVTCQNTDTGFGFKLARESYTVFAGDGVPGSAEDGTVPTRFVGSWYGHGRALTISADGHGTIIYRTYKTCTERSQQACDKTEGNEIHPGGRIKISMHTATPTKITGRVTSSNDPDVDVGTNLTATVAQHVVRLNLWSGVTFCADAAYSASKCGA